MDKKAAFHLPGLFEFRSFYSLFLPLYSSHREYFHPWCSIASIYGAPADCLWGGGRVGYGDDKPEEVLALLEEYGISGRLTFSNSLLEEKHLSDRKCNRLSRLFSESNGTRNGVIVHSDLLLDYLRKKYPNLYFVSSTTKVLTSFNDFRKELEKPEFSFVVPDFRLNRDMKNLEALPQEQKDKVEFLVNECCAFTCGERKKCYEAVSRMSLGDNTEHVCPSGGGYRFSKAMENPRFIGMDDIRDTYLPLGFSNFKIEGRSLGSALLLEFILHYMVKPEYHLAVREELYLESSLDLF